MIPTTVNLRHAGEDGEIEIRYPKSATRKLAFNKNPLALYEGLVELAITVKARDMKAARIEFIAQACSDQICLEPETLQFVP